MDPPYIPSGALPGLTFAVQEPRLALDGGPDGLDCIRRLFPQAAEKLSAGGLVLVEIESSLGKQAAALARESFPGSRIDILKDLAGLDRVLRIETAAGLEA